MDILPEIENDWNNWYNSKHIPSRLNIPGFLSARRFVAVDGDPKYMTIYDLADVHVLKSEAYLKLRDKEAALPSGSFEAITPTLPNYSRGLYEQIYPEQGEYQIPNTEFLFVVGLDVPPAREEEFNAWYNTEHILAMLRVPGFVTARRFVAAQIELPPRAGTRPSGPKYCALYDLESEKVRQSAAYLKERESPWTSWVRSWYIRRWLGDYRRIYP